MYLSHNMTLKWNCCFEDGTTAQMCLHVQQDDDMTNDPRQWDNLATLACWHRNYTLGDDLEGKTQLQWWQEMVSENVPVDYLLDESYNGQLEQVKIRTAKANPANYDIYYYEDADCDESNLEDWEPRFENVYKNDVMNWVAEDLTIRDCKHLLDHYATWLPIYLYDHSGITISYGRGYPFDDPWDAGQVGWAFISKKTVLGNFPNDDPEKWERKGLDILRREIETYDCYLRGECYGYTLYEWDSEDRDWSELDSCYGFIGSDPIKNGMADAVGHGLQNEIESDAVTVGEAEAHVITVYTF